MKIFTNAQLQSYNCIRYNCIRNNMQFVWQSAIWIACTTMSTLIDSIDFIRIDARPSQWKTTMMSLACINGNLLEYVKNVRLVYWNWKHPVSSKTRILRKTLQLFFNNFYIIAVLITMQYTCTTINNDGRLAKINKCRIYSSSNSSCFVSKNIRIEYNK